MSRVYEVTCIGRTREELKNEIAKLYAEEFETDVSYKSKVASVREVVTDYADNEEYVDESEIGQTLSQAPVDMSDLDSKGMPWDANVHTSARTKVKDGSWKVKRGVTDDQVNAAQAQYRGGASVPQSTPQHSPVSQPVVHQAPVVMTTQHYDQKSDTTVVKIVEPVVTPPLTPPALPVMNAGHTLETFKKNFALNIGNLITEGKVSQEYINTLKQHFKVDQIWLINDAQQTEVFNSFVGWGFITKVG